MRNLVGTFGVMAGLSLLAISLFVVAVTVPYPSGGNMLDAAIGLSLFVYFLALIVLAQGAVSVPQAREAIRPRFKVLFLASVVTVVAYCAYVSYLVYALMHLEI